MDDIFQCNDYALSSYPLYDVVEYANCFTGVAADFLYDTNGNLTADLDQTIIGIRYNVLNLPEVIQFQNGNQVINTYNTAGHELRTKYYTSLLNVNLPAGVIHGTYTTSKATLVQETQ